MTRTEIRPGECFLRVSSPLTKWWVERIIEYPGLPPHARLFRDEIDPATITIALSVLLDERHFVRHPGEAQ